MEGCEYLMDRDVLKLQYKGQCVRVQILHNNLLDSNSMQ